MIKERTIYEIIGFGSQDARHGEKDFEGLKVVIEEGEWRGPWFMGDLVILKPSKHPYVPENITITTFRTKLRKIGTHK